MRTRRSSGFTLVELIIVLAIVGIIVLLGTPAMLKILDRQALIASAKEVAQVMRVARFTAIKQSLDVRVTVDYANRKIYAFTDANNNCVIDGTDVIVDTVSMARSIQLWGPTDAAAGGTNASEGFPEDALKQGCADFQPAGSVAAVGAFRFKNRNNDFLEVRVDPAATGRVFLRKWFGGADPTTNWWQNGEQGHNWWQ
jgi:prepilin-type N-terminal cleavage/methylation domain-containing protein